MTTIPKNTILQSKGLGDTIGDIVESFNLDLSYNYGAVRTTRTKKVPVYNASSYYFATQKALGFVNFLGNYYFITENTVFKGGAQPADRFDNVFTDDNINEATGDIKIFNSQIYVSSGSQLSRTANGTDWTTPVSSGLASSPHLLETFKNRLYITNNYSTIVSINTSNAIVSVGTSGALNLNLSADWTITTIKKVGNLLWFGVLNTSDGRGLVGSWDGSSLDVNSLYELPSGVMSSTVLDNVLYIIDAQGVIKRFNGATFGEVARLPKKFSGFFANSMSLTNGRFIHPNGMQTTDRDTILVLLSNSSDVDSDDTIPSGIWEYDKNIGLYHKYSISTSLSTDTVVTDFGQVRISSPGAIFASKPSVKSSTDNGNLLFGAKYFTDATNTAWGVFCDDSLDTTQKYGYFVTSKIFGKINEQWNKVYAIYKKFINSTSEITIKYRTEEDIPTETVVTWTDIDRFTSSVSLASYAVGDEVQVLQGAGAGFSTHISSIDGSTYIIDEQLPSSCIGLTTKANISKWKKVGTGKITINDKEQFKALTITEKNTSPFIQFKVCMKFNGKDELNKLQIISKEIVKE
jgi:hypothetical protein